MNASTRKYASWLWLLLLLFCGRVLGQMLVAFWNVGFLPPMEEWHSGLMPYPVLLAAQFAIIVLLTKVALDFTRRTGYFATPNRRLGKGLLWFGWIYLIAMILRYVIRMTLYPEERWFGGTIPIFFHYVLASFVLLVAHYHQAQPRTPPPQHGQTRPPLGTPGCVTRVSPVPRVLSPGKRLVEVGDEFIGGLQPNGNPY